MTAKLEVSNKAFQDMSQSDWNTTLKIIADETGCSPVLYEDVDNERSYQDDHECRIFGARTRHETIVTAH